MIFLIPRATKVTGGGLQIVRLYRETSTILSSTDSATALCWIPGHGFGYSQLAPHDQDVTVCPLRPVLSQLRDDCQLCLHVPELYTHDLYHNLLGQHWFTKAASTKRLHLNVLNQNATRCPSPYLLQSIAAKGVRVTATTGKSHWASPSEQSRLGIPIHWLPTWYYQDSADWQPYDTKDNLILLSPDKSDYREAVISALSKGLPNLTIRVVSGLSFAEYTELERRAKWAITFGEGCDGFFYGPAMRGGISFAVHNDTFSGWDVAQWASLFKTPEQLVASIVDRIRCLDNKYEYESYSRRLRDRFARYRGPEVLRSRLAEFYAGQYSLHPAHGEGIHEGPGLAATGSGFM